MKNTLHKASHRASATDSWGGAGGEEAGSRQKRHDEAMPLGA